MADAADIAQQDMEALEALLPPRAPYALPPGVRGWCAGCEQYSPRLINDHCGRCRDQRHLP